MLLPHSLTPPLPGILFFSEELTSVVGWERVLLSWVCVGEMLLLASAGLQTSLSATQIGWGQANGHRKSIFLKELLKEKLPSPQASEAVRKMPEG